MNQVAFEGQLVCDSTLSSSATSAWRNR